MSSHIPVNHRLRPLYRTLAGTAGLFCLVFGIVGVTKTSGDSLFHRGDVVALGLRTNLAFAILSIIVGAVVLVGALIGRNIDHFINLIGGIVFLVAGIAMMLVLQTDANFLNFGMSTCIVSFIIGTVLFAAGLYGRTGPPEIEAREEHARLHHGTDPDNHAWAYHGAPPRPTEDHPDGHRFA
jgi:hypothetical protein